MLPSQSPEGVTVAELYPERVESSDIWPGTPSAPDCSRCSGAHVIGEWNGRRSTRRAPSMLSRYSGLDGDSANMEIERCKGWAKLLGCNDSLNGDEPVEREQKHGSEI